MYIVSSNNNGAICWKAYYRPKCLRHCLCITLSCGDREAHMQLQICCFIFIQRDVIACDEKSCIKWRHAFYHPHIYFEKYEKRQWSAWRYSNEQRTMKRIAEGLRQCMTPGGDERLFVSAINVDEEKEVSRNARKSFEDMRMVYFARQTMRSDENENNA